MPYHMLCCGSFAHKSEGMYMFGFSFAPTTTVSTPVFELGPEFFVNDIPEGDVIDYLQGKLGGWESLEVENALVASGIERKSLYATQDKIADGRMRVVRRRTA